MKNTKTFIPPDDLKKNMFVTVLDPIERIDSKHVSGKDVQYTVNVDYTLIGVPLKIREVDLPFVQTDVIGDNKLFILDVRKTKFKQLSNAFVCELYKKLNEQDSKNPVKIENLELITDESEDTEQVHE